MFPDEQLTQALLPARLEALAGRGAFARAAELFRGDRAHGLRIEPRIVTGTIRDGVWREASLALEPDGFVWNCSCGSASAARPCEHVVALGLEASDSRPSWELRQRRIGILLPLDGDWPGRLPALSISAMKQLLVSDRPTAPGAIGYVELACSTDPGSRERARKLLDLVLDCFHTRGHIDGHGYQQLHSRGGIVLNSIQRDAKRLASPDLVQLLEAALASIESVLGAVDDSKGGFGYLLGQCSRLHEHACQGKGLDPVALAKRLASWSAGSDFEVFPDPENTHGRAMGSSGIAAYRHEIDRQPPS